VSSLRSWLRSGATSSTAFLVCSALQAQGGTQAFLVHGAGKSCSDITQLDSALTSGNQQYFAGWTAKDFDDALAWSQACANYGWHIPGKPRLPMLQAQRDRSLGVSNVGVSNVTPQGAGGAMPANGAPAAAAPVSGQATVTTTSTSAAPVPAAAITPADPAAGALAPAAPPAAAPGSGAPADDAEARAAAAPTAIGNASVPPPTAASSTGAVPAGGAPATGTGPTAGTAPATGSVPTTGTAPATALVPATGTASASSTVPATVATGATGAMPATGAPLAAAAVIPAPGSAGEGPPSPSAPASQNIATPLPAPAPASLQPLGASGVALTQVRATERAPGEIEEDRLLTDEFFKEHFHRESLWVSSKANLDVGGRSPTSAQMKNRITADKIVLYCARKANSGESGGNRPLLWDWRWCEGEEAAAYNRLVTGNEFPNAGRAALLGCANVESYVYLERCIQSVSESGSSAAARPAAENVQ